MYKTGRCLRPERLWSRGNSAAAEGLAAAWPADVRTLHRTARPPWFERLVLVPADGSAHDFPKTADNVDEWLEAIGLVRRWPGSRVAALGSRRCQRVGSGSGSGEKSQDI